MTKRFPGSPTDAVSALNLEVPTGSIVTLIGPSGCGKTTTLRLVNRLIEPTSGRLEVNGVDVTSQPVTTLRRSIGYVIQEGGLFPHRTVAQNIATVPKTIGWDKGRTAERVAELAELVRLDPTLLDRFPDELSGGQQQRVGVARALAADPPVLLMDEPFGAVDPIVRTGLQDELLLLQEQVRKTIVLVTHDIDEALKLADRIALLNVGGVLEQYAAPDLLLSSPANDFVEEFVGEDRGMKRLGLKTVADVAFRQGPIVDLDADPAAAIAAANDSGTVWFGATREDRFIGWAHIDDLRDGRALGDVTYEPPAAKVTPESSLRSAMELIMTSRTSVAVVESPDGFAGVVTLEAIRETLASESER